MAVGNNKFGERIDKSIAKLPDKEAESVRRWAAECLAEGKTTRRVLKCVSSIVSIYNQLSTLGINRGFDNLTRDDLIRWLGWLYSESSYSEWTKKDFCVILRLYLKWLGRGDLTKVIKPREPRNKRLPGEILTEEEIMKMAQAALFDRDRAAVLVLYEAGLRVGEFLNLKLRDITFDDAGGVPSAVLRVKGKTGQRRVRIFSAVPALQAWLEQHPGKDNPGAYVWCELPTPNRPKEGAGKKPISYNRLVKILRECAKRAGVKKKVNPHAFRHARASFLANFLTEAQMKEFFGWVQNSDMAAVYVHLSGRDVDGALEKLYGIEREEKREPVIKPRKCPRCQSPVSPGTMFCRSCGSVVDPDTLFAKPSDLEERVQKLEEKLNLLRDLHKLLTEAREIKALLESLKG